VTFEPLLEPAAAAALLGIHEKTLIRKAREHNIPGFRVGKKWYFRESVLDRWLKDQVESECQPSQSTETIL
jgi:excisionase family DNA binding protein